MIPAHLPAWPVDSATVLIWMGLALVGGTMAAALAWVLTASALRRARPVVHAAVWTVVLLKFVIPVGPGLRFSLATAVARAHAAMQPDAPSQAESAPAAPSSPAQPGWIVLNRRLGAAPTAAPAALSQSPATGWTEWVALAYAAALTMIAARRWRAYRAFARECRRLPLADAYLRDAVAGICRREGVRRVPIVRISHEAPAPFVFGAWRPTLVLSCRQLVRPDELEAVVLHEIAHLRRGDLYVRYLQWCAGTFLFFWPVVAWVNRRIDLAREHACDEWALRRSAISAGDYARCLLRALHPHGRMPAYRPAAMAANLKSVQRRIEVIMESPNRSLRRGSLSLPAGLFVVAWAAFILAGAAAANNLTDEKKQTTDNKDVMVKADGDKVVIVTDDTKDGQSVQVRAQVIRIAGDKDSVHEFRTDGSVQGRRLIVNRIGKGEFPGAIALAMDLNSTKALAEFLKAHPTADANGDSKLTQSELDAFLVARAMSSPAETLRQFPDADRNKDNRLSADEAARLVVMPCAEAMAIAGDLGDCKAETASGQQIRVIARAMATTRADAKSADAATSADAAKVGQARGRMVIGRKAGHKDDAGQAEVAPFEIALSAGGAREWLKKEIATEPAAVEVAKYVSVVEAAPQVAFLEAHPDADTNRDGKLTREEQSAFLEQLTGRMLAKHRPELDTNGDGIVSKDEAAAASKDGNVRVLVRKKVENISGQVHEEESADIVPADGDEDVMIPLQIEIEEESDSDAPPPGGGQ